MPSLPAPHQDGSPSVGLTICMTVPPEPIALTLRGFLGDAGPIASPTVSA
jgi:hypothetical protein